MRVVRNRELIWLIGRLAPDFKAIAGEFPRRRNLASVRQSDSKY